MQKESLERGDVGGPARALGMGLSLVAWALSGCVTGQLVDDGSFDQTNGGSSSTSGGSGGTVAAHPSGGSGGGVASAGHPGVAGHGGVSGSGTGTGGMSGSSPAAGMGGAAMGTGGSAGSVGVAGMPGSAGAPADCSNKRGIAYAFNDSTAGPDMSALKSGVSWFYGWSTGPSGAAKPVYAAQTMEFVPMVWGGGFNVQNVENAIPAGSKYLLGFNEPNFGNEANLTPQAAAGMWPQIEQIAAQKQLQIVSPAVNYCAGNCNQTDPFAWLDAFFAACPNCKVDYIGAHWYACTIDALQTYIGTMKKYNKPIWLTEFACADGGPYTAAQVKTYALEAELWLEHEPSIFRYSWFSGRTTAIANVNLLASGGVLTDLGTAYVNQAPKRCQ